MDAYIARQPIMSEDGKVVAYEVLYHQDSSTLYNQRDFKVANAIARFFSEIDTPSFLEGKDAFLTFTPNLLMQNIPRIFVEDKLVIQIEDNVLVHPVALTIIQRYRNQGYRLALSDFEFNNRYFGILNSVSILKIDFSDPDSDTINNRVSIAKRFKKTVVAYNINSPRAWEKALELGCDYFQGASVADMISGRFAREQALDSDFFNLMIRALKEEPEITEVAAIIERDMSLSFSLLKMVNSSYFAPAEQVCDIRQALAIVGFDQLKRWIYLLDFMAEDGCVSEELIRISLQRAYFCQELSALIKDFPLDRAESYLLGMFSTLGTLLNVGTDKALERLPVSQTLKDGINGEEGPARDLYRFVQYYERGEWNRMIRVAERLEIPVSMIAQKYFDVIQYVNEMYGELIRPYTGDSEASAG